ncbi:transcriptional regulator [Stygiolobus caldivivus]|uniref:Transcriptional regulator n=1 Tax=Stygiolobus caldivivus TaxID=2824673 RepID=A0A8D5U4T4_9CREN|nr:transcriptional regulator [Stygiolobus caldivivus]BCU69267.1 transcriptional regulator [Stygiolobus caldivivus]
MLADFDFLTTREKIIILLKYSDYPLTAKEIKERLCIENEKIVYEHLLHIAKSLKRKNMQLIVYLPKCRKCGYVFNLEKPKKPSKCPKCKSEDIEPPRFLIR